MGMTALGEISNLPNPNDLPHYDSLMLGAIIFPKRNKKSISTFEVARRSI